MRIAPEADYMVHPVTTAADPESDATNSDGAANAATVPLGSVSTKVDVFADSAGAATLTVEVSTDGNTWRVADTVSLGSATVTLEQYDFAYPQVRAYLDANTNTVEVVKRGI